MLTTRQVVSTVIGTTLIFMPWLSLNNAPVALKFKYSSALADPPPKSKAGVRYVPPKRGNPKSTTATGSRGCTQSAQSQPESLTLLVPNDHDGRTTSGHPTFFWHMSAPVPIAFVLTQPGVVQPLWQQQMQPQTAGIMQLKMPENLPELVPGKEYRWSVTLICNAMRPSANPYIQAWIERVPTMPTLTQQLAAAKSNRDRARIYAQAGLWYDALAAISTADHTHSQNVALVEVRLSLLEQVGLNQVAAQERRRLANR